MDWIGSDWILAIFTSYVRCCGRSPTFWLCVGLLFLNIQCHTDSSPLYHARLVHSPALAVFVFFQSHSPSFLPQVVTLVVEREVMTLPRVSHSADARTSASNHSNSPVTSPQKTNSRVSISTPPNRISDQPKEYSFVTDGRSNLQTT